MNDAKHAALCACALAVLGWSGASTARAEEGKPDKDEKAAEQKADADDKDIGDKFTSFWIHNVGGTIYSGLKRGTGKVQNAFTGGSRERDIANDRHKIALKLQDAKTDL